MPAYASSLACAPADVTAAALRTPVNGADAVRVLVPASMKVTAEDEYTCGSSTRCEGGKVPGLRGV